MPSSVQRAARLEVGSVHRAVSFCFVGLWLAHDERCLGTEGAVCSMQQAACILLSQVFDRIDAACGEAAITL